MLKMKKHIPNVLTLLNLFCGILAVIFVLKGHFEIAFWSVVLGITFDFFDGFVARLLKVNSPLGVQLDSLADVITSGLVPGLVMFQLMENVLYFPYPLPYLAFLITLASAYRLAKFNIDERQSDSFIGLPTPANSLFITSLALCLIEDNSFPFLFNSWFLLGITLIFSYLLISEIPLFALKFKDFSLEKNLKKYVFLGISALLLMLFWIKAIPLIILLYICLSILWKDK